jgi:5-methyltetrahydropteroyltriglutamate--homocysteine methyltransferase
MVSLGASVYDVHSSVVPTVKFVREQVKRFLDTGIGRDTWRIWGDPDRGLKTRDWAEVLPSLRNHVAARALHAAACTLWSELWREGSREAAAAF